MFCMKKVKDREPWGWEEYTSLVPLIPCHSSLPTCMIDMPQLQQYFSFSRKQGV